MSDDQGIEETAVDAVDASTEVVAEPVAEAKTYDQAYVDSLRDENAKSRIRAKEYEEVFGDYADDDRSTWFELAKTYKNDPAGAAAQFEQIAASLKAQQEATAVQNYEAGTPVTMEALEARFAQERAAIEQERLSLQIDAEARELGYNDGTPERDILYTLAARLPDGDLKKAHEQLQGMQQKYVDEYLAKKRAEAESSPVAPGGQGQTPSQEVPLKTFKDAQAAARIRIESEQAAR